LEELEFSLILGFLEQRAGYKFSNVCFLWCGSFHTRERQKSCLWLHSKISACWPYGSSFLCCFCSVGTFLMFL